MVQAGMSVARLNFSHGSYEDHASTVALIRSVSEELDTPITVFQDLQGPKIRVGQIPGEGKLLINTGDRLTLVPIADYTGQPDTVSIDYPDLAEDAEPGTQVLLDDGLLELRVEKVQGTAVQCEVIKGGILKSRKGVNLPSLPLRLPSLTEKDKQDLEFGISQGVDWVSLSFVRKAEDVQTLRDLLTQHGAADTPVLAKIEKPQAVENLEAILSVVDGIMVARGDLGVEIPPEKVPGLQKKIIRRCNQKGIPVITATQMLESMISNPRPTRAEANDVANAILDGTDAVMLSGESAVGEFPVQAVEMMSRIAHEVEKDLHYFNHPPDDNDETHAISEAINAIDQTLDLRCIVALTSSGYSARLAAEERPKALVVAVTPHLKVYHRLNLIWGVKPVVIENEADLFEDVIQQVEQLLKQRKLVETGDRVLIMGGIPMKQSRGTNFLKLHKIGA
jgi:pyruvate kinase